MQLLAIPQNTKSIGTETIADGFCDGHGGRCGNGSINCIAALLHHSEARLRSQRVRGGNNIARKHRQARGRIRGTEIKAHGLVQRYFAFADNFFPFGRLG